jgi:preprotein translocase subunit SecE
VNAFLQELWHTGLYKRSQGRVARQVTAAALVIAVALGLWQLSQQLVGLGPAVQFGVPLVLLLAGLWISYRLVNVPQFADFLIAVEAEMNKVSWPTRRELIRSSLVVLITILTLAFFLFMFDFFWKTIFTYLGVL